MRLNSDRLAEKLPPTYLCKISGGWVCVTSAGYGISIRHRINLQPSEALAISSAEF